MCVTILIDFFTVIHKLYKGDKGYIILTFEKKTNTIQIDCSLEDRKNRDG